MSDKGVDIFLWFFSFFYSFSVALIASSVAFLYIYEYTGLMIAVEGKFDDLLS